jgi:septum formation protein
MLILASASPRRLELLNAAGLSFAVQPANVDETPIAGEGPRECAERLAREKALTVWRNRPGDLVLGADTIVVVGGEILGKPVDADDATRMLRMLSGRKHEVITGVCLAGAARGGRLTVPSGEVESQTACETTVVTMSEISEEEIRSYVATGEPMDKAGAYAIQGIASRWIPHIEGDYSNVVGLPVALVYRMLRERQSR